MTPTVDWDKDVFAQGKHLLRWPYTEVVSALIRATAGRERASIPVLEIGCGTGNNVWFFAAEGFRAHGIDASQTAIDYARQRLLALELNADLRVGEIAALPWPDEHFEFIIDRGALTHNAQQHVANILDEAWRVLKPGGTFLSFTLFGMSHPERLHGEEVANHTFDNFRAGYFRTFGLTSFFTRDDLRALFHRFSKTEIARITMHDDHDRIVGEEFFVTATK